jgi:hypothetical protein
MASALPLLVLRIPLADDARYSVALDHLAMLTDGLHAAANFHDQDLTIAVTIFGPRR